MAGGGCNLFSNFSYADDSVVSNPEPIIDIAVNVPADYPGTFLDFKAELEKQLEAEGLDPSLFRITSSAVKIDTTDTSGWYVYDHYYNQAEYDKLKLSADQKLKQPFRAADTSYDTSNLNGTVVSIEDVFLTDKYPQSQYPNKFNKLWRFNQHIHTYKDSAEKANMIFAGYGKVPLVDFMLYPAASDTRRTFSFNMDASKINTHTLDGAGFLLNSGITADGKLNGYLLYYYGFSATGTGTVAIYKLTNIDASNAQSANLKGTLVKSQSFSLGAQKKARISVDLQKDKVTVQQQNFNADNTLADVQTLFSGSVPIALTGYNGFGPLMGYASHGCAGMTSYQFLDLDMTYEASSFDALKNVQYYKDAEYKYFINLAGSKNDPEIPKDKEAYLEGINRLNNNEIFYVSNIDDGKVLTNPTTDSTGIGVDNGLYATDKNYVKQIAAFITERYQDANKFKPVTIQENKDKPVADFYISKAGTDDQIMTLHLQHLQSATDKILANIHDTSFSPAGNTITQWKLKVYDPNNNVIYDSKYVNSPANIKDVEFNRGNTTQGRYIFELTVKDDKGNESSPFQTYLTTYRDETGPKIEAASQGNKSKATVTLTDLGYGIDSDGITLIEGAGSGVKSYQVGNGKTVVLDKEQHSVSFTTVLTADDLEVTTWDECGNKSNKVFQTAKVSFDKGTNDPYYVLKGNVIGELPTGPDSDDPAEHFKGWADQDGNIVGSGTVVTQDVILHPVYTTEMVKITFNPNGGSLGDSDKTIEVPKGSSVIDNLPKNNPTREGHTFNGWTLSNQVIADQKADNDITVVATWKVNNYKLKFDANGGSLGVLKEKEVAYGSNLKNAVTYASGNIKYEGRDLPSRIGYTFVGWTKKDGSDLGTMTMPAEDYTVYAKWALESGKFVVSFDSQGGSEVSEQAYSTSETVYRELPVPSKTGYTFAGWYYNNSKKNQGTALAAKGNHTLEAKWTAKSDTPYEIKHFISTESGYREVEGSAVSKKGTTGETVNVGDNDVLKNLGDDYWYNPHNPNAVNAGKIAGSPKLVLKLYYDRYFDISVTTKGNGKAEGGAVHIPEWSSNTITWKANDGYHVSRIMIDGVIRDDLLNKTEFTFASIRQDHNVYIEFAKGNGGGNVNPNPNPDDDETNAPKYYQIKTAIEGCSDNRCSITPTKRVSENGEATVNWTLGEGYRITEITVDGIPYDDIDKVNEINFKGIKANHDVVVKVEKTPSAGGGSAKGHYTVTVNQYGGDSTSTVSPSAIVDAGQNVTVEWNAGDSFDIYKVIVDGSEIPADKIGTYNFDSISRNHVVDVYFTKSGQPEEPSFSEDQHYKIKTQIIGGPGTITGGGIVEAGSDYDVQWTVAPNTSDNPEDSNYASYEVDKVVVNGKVVVPDEENRIYFDSINADTEVEVYLTPILYDVDIYKFGNGEVSVSKKLYKGQHYKKIEATPNSGCKIAKVVIDGEEQPIGGSMSRMSFKALSDESSAPEKEVRVVSEQNFEMGVNNISEDHEVEVYFTGSGDTDPDGSGGTKPDEKPDGSGDTIPEPDSLYKVNAEIIGGPGSVTGQGFVQPGGEANVVWDIPDGYIVKSVTVNGVETSFGDSSILLEAINANKEVEIYVEKSAPGDEVTDGGNFHVDVHTITTEIRGGSGEITSGATIAQGGHYNVEWSVDVDDENNYKVKDVIVDGVSRPDLVAASGIGNIAFSNISADHDVVVIIGAKLTVDVDVDGDGKPDINIDTDGDGIPDVNIDLDGDKKPDVNIDTDNTGEWKPSGEGGTADGIWKPDTNIDKGNGKPDGTDKSDPIDADGNGVDDRWKPDKNVYPNGESMPGYDTYVPPANGGGIILPPDINIDTDGDGEPDVNIDTDGDGKPDINIDTDGDGKPDTNIDSNGDGKPDTNIDTDGDGKPDVNVDNDGDGKPDTNIDTDGDGKPDTNIDTDGDGKPDTNIDTDGDGKPDVNVDTDGDGKPDTNIDTNGDGKPDTNIDTDGDGKPDINIDTDGDGKPDVNIDTDGDGIPDVNIDTDGDGIPDKNLRPAGQEEDTNQSGKNPNDANKPAKGNDDKKGSGREEEEDEYLVRTSDQNPLEGLVLMLTLALGALWALIRRKKEELESWFM